MSDIHLDLSFHKSYYSPMNKPGVGIGVIVIKGNKVLIGHRASSHGKGTWGLPGGKLEWCESPEECAAREVFEETGLKVKNIIFSGVYTNDIFKDENKHNITLFMIAEYISGQPETTEPDKVVSWQWMEWEKLPSPLFLPLKHLIEIGFKPFSRISP